MAQVIAKDPTVFKQIETIGKHIPSAREGDPLQKLRDRSNTGMRDVGSFLIELEKLIQQARASASYAAANQAEKDAVNDAYNKLKASLTMEAGLTEQQRDQLAINRNNASLPPMILSGPVDPTANPKLFEMEHEQHYRIPYKNYFGNEDHMTIHSVGNSSRCPNNFYSVATSDSSREAMLRGLVQVEFAKNGPGATCTIKNMENMTEKQRTYLITEILSYGMKVTDDVAMKYVTPEIIAKAQDIRDTRGQTQAPQQAMFGAIQQPQPGQQQQPNPNQQNPNPANPNQQNPNPANPNQQNPNPANPNQQNPNPANPGQPNPANPNPNPVFNPNPN